MEAATSSAARRPDVAELATLAVGGDRRALARLLTVIERGGDPAEQAAVALHDHVAVPYAVGITGAPGAGKSTLSDALVAIVRAKDERIAVVAIDPSSPFTGGAILGDRVRLRGEHAADDAVYVRSLANRGHLGGLARAVPEVVRALGACGWPTVLMETVGVGQAEVEIARQADTTAVVVTPGWGDEIQANKAGLLEIADVLVVNKADREGARSTVRDLRRMLDLAGSRDWVPPIVSTVAVDGTGCGEAWEAVLAHRAHLEATGALVRRREDRLVSEVRQRAIAAVATAVDHAMSSAEGVELVRALRAGRVAPAVAASAFLDAARSGATP